MATKEEREAAEKRQRRGLLPTWALKK